MDMGCTPSCPGVNIHFFTVFNALLSNILWPELFNTRTFSDSPRTFTVTNRITVPSHPRLRARGGYVGFGFWRYSGFAWMVAGGVELCCCRGALVAGIVAF